MQTQKTANHLEPKIQECLAVIGEKTFELSTIISHYQDSGIPLPQETQEILHGFRVELNSVIIRIAPR